MVVRKSPLRGGLLLKTDTENRHWRVRLPSDRHCDARWDRDGYCVLGKRLERGDRTPPTTRRAWPIEGDFGVESYGYIASSSFYSFKEGYLSIVGDLGAPPPRAPADGSPLAAPTASCGGRLRGSGPRDAWTTCSHI